MSTDTPFAAPFPAPLEDPVALSIATLNRLLRGELAALETYEKAVAYFDARPPHPLCTCLESHRHRAQVVRDRLDALGGIVATGSGAWGVFARSAEAVAAVLGHATILRALHEGEELGLADYRKALDALDEDSRALVERSLLPEQEETVARMRALCVPPGTAGAAGGA
jgi:hypothetical protein